MPQQQQTQLQQQQRRSGGLGSIFGMVSSIIKPFLPAPAGVAMGFLSGMASGDPNQVSSSVAQMTNADGAAAPDDQQDKPATEVDTQSSPDQQQQQGFVGPDVQGQGVPEQIPGTMSPQDRWMHEQQQQQEGVFQMLEHNVPDLPFMVQQNPQFIPAAQNFLGSLQKRYQKGDNNGQ